MRYLIIFFVFVISLSSQTLHAQQNHFVYIQADNKQPFYIKLNNKILSSSSTGYLIISKLAEGNYKFAIGFPKSEWPQQNVDINVSKNDQGFLLKNFGDKGWGLFNIQTGEVLMAGNIATKEEKVSQPMENDLFSTMLANVVNDSTILQKDIVKDEVKNQPAEIKKEVPKETVASIVPDSNKADISLSVIKRTLRKKTKEGTELVYIDEFDKMKDTIRIFIPVEKELKKDTLPNKNVVVKTDPGPAKKDVVVKDDSDTVKKEVALKNDIVSGQKQEPVPGEEKLKEQKPVYEVKQELNEDKPPVKEYKFIEDKKDKHTATKSAMINSDCKAFAGDDDFLKLRKKMAAETSDENMIKVAKKAFKSKCYSTELIKNLSPLFLKDDGKYMFFDAAYPYVSDSDSFSALRNQLTDSYYINRFDAMVHK